MSLNKSKKPLYQNSLGRNQMPRHFFWAATCVTGTLHWLLGPVKVSNSSELYPDTRLFYFFECLGIQFFNSVTCDLLDAMPCQGSPTLLPREAEDFTRGDNHSKYMPLLTCLVWLQPIYFNPKLVFMPVNTAKVLLVAKTLKGHWTNFTIFWKLADNVLYAKIRR